MTDHDPIETQLVAYLHGELGPTERRAVTERLRRDPEARARLEVLEAADHALTEALDRDDAPRPAAGIRSLAQPLLALAALVAVAAIFVFQVAETDSTAGRNEHLELRAAPAGGAAVPLFTDAALELHWQNLNAEQPRRPIRVTPYPFGKTLAGLGTEIEGPMVLGEGPMVLPIVVTAEITDPEGTVLQARWAPNDGKHFDIPKKGAVQTVRLRDFEISAATPRPTLIGQPGDREWLKDGRWAFSHMAKNKTARWFPEIPGEYQIALRVETPPPPSHPDNWPSFTEPVKTTTAILMAGQMTDWGAAHKGISARLVWSSGCRSADTTPFALQLKNDANQPLKYNYGGSTIAKIPQPMHYTLIVDGREWTQKGVPLFMPASEGSWPHPVGMVRTFVTRADYWRDGGRSIGKLPGPHRVQVVFDFRPSIWNQADTSIWFGKAHTPELVIDVPKTK